MSKGLYSDGTGQTVYLVIPHDWPFAFSSGLVIYGDIESAEAAKEFDGVRKGTIVPVEVKQARLVD